MGPNCKYMYMKKANFLLISILGLILFSCSNKGNFDVGEDLIDTQSGIQIIDTFQVRMSTVKLDSVPTSGTKQLLCGKYSSTITGSTELIPYFNFDLGGELTKITVDDRFDSITLKLGFNGYYMGDTTLVDHYQLYRLTQFLDFVEDDVKGDYVYNKTSFPHEEVPLGNVSFFPNVSEDSIEFRMNDAFGLELMNMVINDATELSNNEEFNEYLKGFVLKGSPESKVILGFKGDTSGVKINIYTHIVGPGEPQKKRYTIRLAETEKTHYNQAVSDRTNTAFAGLSIQDEEIPARNSGNRSFIEGSAGVVSRIDFPSLNDIFLYGDRVMIKAQLVFYPSVENDPKFLPETIQFYESNKHNDVGTNLVTSSGSQQVAVQATLQRIDSSKKIDEDIYNLYYVADITEYLTTQFSGNYFNKENGLLLTIPLSDLQTSADLLILNGEKTEINTLNPKLQLYFLKYE